MHMVKSSNMKGSCTGVALLALMSVEMSGHAQPAAVEPVPSVRISPKQVRKQIRQAHPDYRSLSAGLVLFGTAYGLALADPIRHHFEGSSGRRAYPLAGPWLSPISWAWALDGVLQLGGVAFIANAFVNPVVVVGTAIASQPNGGSHDTIVELRGTF